MVKKGRWKTEFVVLHRAWSDPFTTKSDFARENADMVAELGFSQLITTLDAHGFGPIWKITPLGLEVLWNFLDLEDDDDDTEEEDSGHRRGSDDLRNGNERGGTG